MRTIFRTGCLVSLIGPVLGFVLYPRMKWLFAFALLGVVLLVLNALTAKDSTPQQVADRAESLLHGDYGAYDVDDYEHLNPRNPELRELWKRTMVVGGLPEEWARLDDGKKNELREIISILRQASSRDENAH